MLSPEYHEPTPALAPLVVKLGGSLHPHVPALVPILRTSPRPLLIVPGGGTYADSVRQARFDDETSHWKAIDAMDTYGRYIATFGLPVTNLLAVPEQTRILLPASCMRQHDPLPHTWDVTSDTIAAWVAAELHLDLLLLKSVDGITAGKTLKNIIRAPVNTDAVDPCFLPFVIEHKVTAFITNGSHPDTVARFLRGEAVSDTQISTTF